MQQLASAVWNATDEEADDDSYRHAFAWCVDVNSESYRNVCDRLTETQIGLLRAVANGVQQLTSTATLRQFRMGTSANVVKNKRILSEQDIIVVRNDLSDFLDPLFKHWFKSNY